MNEFLYLNHLLVAALEEKMTDILGVVFSTLRLNSKSQCQEFTPSSITNLMTNLVYSDINKIIDEKRLDFYEPSCGSGVMIIATADFLHKHGLNYQKILHVIAQDIDLRCIYMTYIQCSLLGIQAEIVHGDVITNPYPSEKYLEQSIFKTPFYFLAPKLFINSNIHYSQKSKHNE